MSKRNQLSVVERVWNIMHRGGIPKHLTFIIKISLLAFRYSCVIFSELTNLHPVGGSGGGFHSPSWSWFHGTVCILQRRRFEFSWDGSKAVVSGIETKWRNRVSRRFIFVFILHCIYIFPCFVSDIVLIVFATYFLLIFFSWLQVYLWIVVSL